MIYLYMVYAEPEREPYQRSPARQPYVQCEIYIYSQAQVACT